MSPSNRYPPWDFAVVQAVADVLASTGWPGLSGSEITRLLGIVGVADVEAPNKRTRLGAALHNRQMRDGAANCVIRFVTEAMALGFHVQEPGRFDALRDALAEPLSLVGLHVNEQGQVARAGATATTLDEVAQLAGRLRTELRRRGVHPEVVRYCEEELLRPGRHRCEGHGDGRGVQPWRRGQAAGHSPRQSDSTTALLGAVEDLRVALERENPDAREVARQVEGFARWPRSWASPISAAGAAVSSVVELASSGAVGQQSAIRRRRRGSRRSRERCLAGIRSSAMSV